MTKAKVWLQFRIKLSCITYAARSHSTRIIHNATRRITPIPGNSRCSGCHGITLKWQSQIALHSPCQFIHTRPRMQGLTSADHPHTYTHTHTLATSNDHSKTMGTIATNHNKEQLHAMVNKHMGCSGRLNQRQGFTPKGEYPPAPDKNKTITVRK